MAPARTRLARKQNAGLLVGSPSFANTASRTCLPAGRAAASQKWKIIYLQVLRIAGVVDKVWPFEKLMIFSLKVWVAY